jgi:hypothetical protein
MDLRHLVEVTDPISYTPTYSTRDAVLNHLRSTPAALFSMTKVLTGQQWNKPIAVGEWCLTEILCHLRDVDEEINLPRIKRFLSEETPFFPGIVSDIWAKERNYKSQDGRRALGEFLATRLTVLELLGRTDLPWSRSARHAIFGPTTLLELAGFMAGHDRAHIQQLYKTIHIL